MQEDESFEPRCDKCPLVKLSQENEFAVEIYNELNSSFVVNTGTHQYVMDIFEDEYSSLSSEEKRFLFRKLSLISDVCTQFYKENSKQR